MDKVVGSSAVDPGSIPVSSQLRQKNVVGQEIAYLQFCKFFKISLPND